MHGWDLGRLVWMHDVIGLPLNLRAPPLPGHHAADQDWFRQKQHEALDRVREFSVIDVQEQAAIVALSGLRVLLATEDDGSQGSDMRKAAENEQWLACGKLWAG